MGDPGARLERLASLFGQELEDRTRLLHELILELEQGAGVHALGSMRRELHSLKSAARAAGAAAIEQVAHAAEGAVHGLSLAGTHMPPTAWVDALTAAVDLLGTLLREPRTDASEVIGNLVAVTPETFAAAQAEMAATAVLQPHLETAEASPLSLPHPHPQALIKPLPEGDGARADVKKVEQNSVRVSLG